MNWIPKNLKELSQLADKLKAEKHPDIPPFALVKKRFKDTTANDLTKTIIWDMYHVREGVAYRINRGFFVHIFSTYPKTSNIPSCAFLNLNQHPGHRGELEK